MKKFNEYNEFERTMMIMILATFVVNIMALVSMVYITGDFLNLQPIDAEYRYYFDNKVSENLDSEVVDDVVAFCSYQDSNISKVNCVHDFVAYSGIYKYKILNTIDITPTDDIVEEGGDCKSWNVFYRSVFTKLNIKNKDVITNNHVFTLVYDDDFYCIVDSIKRECNILSADDKIDIYFNETEVIQNE